MLWFRTFFILLVFFDIFPYFKRLLAILADVVVYMFPVVTVRLLFVSSKKDTMGDGQNTEQGKHLD